MTTNPEPPSDPTLRIALPVLDGRLHGHFGGSTHFALVDTDLERKLIVSSQTVAAPPHAPGLFPRWLHGQGVKVVIAGGIGRRALDLFAQQGIGVRAGQPGATVEELVTGYLAGNLTGTPEGCAQHGHHHQAPKSNGALDSRRFTPVCRTASASCFRMRAACLGRLTGSTLWSPGTSSTTWMIRGACSAKWSGC